MSFKDEFKREMRNVMKDVEKEVTKTWKVDYKGHTIEIINKMKEEFLIIDGVMVDKNKRKSILSHIVPYSKLSGTLQLEDGTKHTVFVKLGGYVSLNCIVKIGKETILGDSQKLEFLPWENKEKIVPYIQQQVQTHNKIMNDRLPDDEYVYDENHPRLAAGLSDRVIDDIPTPFYVKSLLKQFKEQLHNPITKTRKATYEKITDEHIASYFDKFIEEFQQAQLDESLVQKEALWLLEHAAHREVVKFSISVLGFTNAEKCKDLLFALGLHGEFTPYAIFALKNGTVGANNQIWQLAQSLHGWGKISAVEQLEGTTPEIKHWLLTKGCENPRHLAYKCAIEGDLEGVLYEETISKELYDGAGLIIEALLNENATQGIDDLPYPSAILSRYIYHARMHCKTLEAFYPLMKISKFLDEDQEGWEDRFNNQWKQHEYTSIKEAIKPFINDPNWSQLAMNILKEGYHFKALEIVRFYQIDITSNLFELLEMEPTNTELYLAVMDTKNPNHIRDLCTFAETHFSLSSPSNEEQECLHCIVQDLYEYEGVGLSLIQAALESDNGGLQYHALSVLNEWTPSLWKQRNILGAIKNIEMMTKDKEERKLAKQLLTK